MLHKILQAAAVEFGERGVDGGTIGGVAARAGTSQQLIYHYYSSKAELYQDMMESISKDIHGKFLSIDFEAAAVPLSLARFVMTAFDTCEMLYDHFTSDQVSHRGDFIKRNGSLARTGAELLAILESIMSRGKAEGLVREQTVTRDFFLTLFLMVSGFNTSRAMMSRYLDHPYDGEAGAAAWRVHALEVLLRSVLTEQGLNAVPEAIAVVRD
jgi:AcrR family transcriptional regulator